MLTYLHEAPNRYREDAYRSYCHRVDVWGSYEPASFIYLCLESFAEEAQRYGIDLRCRRCSEPTKYVWFPPRCEREGMPASHSDFDGLLIRLTQVEQIGLVESFLAEHKNVLLLLPNEFAALWSQAERLRPTVEEGLKRLGAGHLVTFFDGKCYKGGDIWWEEVETPRGRLFISIDSHVSDGVFLDTYGYSEHNRSSISRLLREFATSRRKLITITSRNVVRNWPALEPLNLVFEVRNHGPEADSISLDLEICEQFDLVGATSIELPRHLSLAPSSFGVQVVPRIAGTFESVVRIASSNPGLILKMSNIELSVTPKFSTQLREQAAKDSTEFTRLKQSLSTLAPVVDGALIRTLEQLSRVDPGACLNKIRSAAESLCQKITRRKQLDFYGQIQAIQAGRLMSQKAVGYLHTLRVLGNLASHPSGEHLSDGDVRVASFALACVVEEFAKRR